MTNHPSTDELVDRALYAQRQGDLKDAAAIYEAILERAPGHADARYFLSLCLHQMGEHQAALDGLAACPPAMQRDAGFIFNRALVLHALGDFAAAVAALRGLVESGANDPQVRNAYGVALRASGELAASQATLQSLVKDHPGFAGAWFNLGNVHHALGDVAAAVSGLERARTLDPQNPDVIRNLASAYQDAGETDAAIALLREHIGAGHHDAASLNNLGNLYRQTEQHDVALRCFDQAIEIDPTQADARYNRAAVLADLNRTAEAKNAAAGAARARPNFIKATWLSALALPQIYDSEQHRADARRAWIDGLAKIVDSPLPPEGDPAVEAHLAALSEITPFGLAYLGGDDKDAMCLWGDHATKIANRAFPHVEVQRPPGERDRRRIAFVSAHFRAHTIQRLFGRWVTDLDRERFEVCLVSTSGPGDHTTKVLTRDCVAAVTAPLGLPKLVDTLQSLTADVIIYPDIGMDPRTQVLAALRLAPTQLMSWGHPVTSGLPTMDGFLTSALMEPENGADHYRERMIHLPNLSVNFERPAEGDIAADTPVTFLCAQSLFKIPPRQDAVFAQILKTSGKDIAFIAHPMSAVTEAFRDRLFRVLRAHGVETDRVRFLPPTNRRGFLGYLKSARAVLDSFDWSGGNTSLETIAMNTSVVTLPGQFMRGRHTSAMLQRMEVPGWVANTEEDYIERALRLATDDAHLADLQALLKARSGRLFDDAAPINALNEVLAAI